MSYKILFFNKARRARRLFNWKCIQEYDFSL
ncbi:hypothetical protein HDEF_1097 [Candidatus Hamiltonella defensa 5AT (Acyrthosiphon pisum)]|uniref:Uncharacterized protein n=1 Tax=Hamiltonella defensa subsp. Acyrthosiphon pisum (strain 5AT) TaxID=572265 RepID=C4K5C8_HAMD5|nr:hypothetical protein HDEF_1097 [Candidatus Hamiltonella defensa 5AT (Acyrthosiphon pisum)]